MRPARIVAAVALTAAAAATGSVIARSTAGHPAAPVAAAPTAPAASSAAKAPAANGDVPVRQPVVLADGRHPVRLTTVDPSRRTLTFDLVQWYVGEDAVREAAKDHQESPPPNDYYIRNVSHRLRTLLVGSAATITVNGLVGTQQSIPVSLVRLASLTRSFSPMFWITVRHGQIVAVSEQWVP